MDSRQGTSGSASEDGGRALSKNMPAGYKRTAVGVIPEDWTCGRIGDLATRVGGGITPSGGERAYVTEGRPFLRSQNVGWGALVLTDLTFITDELHASFAASEIEEGDVLLNITGASIGRSAVADITIASGNVNQHVCEIRTDPKSLDPHFLSSYLLSAAGQRQIDSFQAGGNRQGLNYSQIRSFLIPRPTLSEQRAIAEALSDVDGLLEALEALIAKKQSIKQAAMQQLLTGKTRLPEFSGEWKTQSLGSLARIKTGTRNNEDKVRGGRYPFYVRSNVVERINSYSYDCEAILVPGEGRIGDIFHYVRGRFDIHQRVYSISHFVPTVCAKFLYFFMIKNFGAWALQNTVKATVDSLRLPTFQEFEMHIPSSAIEQMAISAVLSDIEADIVGLERRLAKILAIKQGMMQQLLTGQVRLVKSRGVNDV